MLIRMPSGVVDLERRVVSSGGSSATLREKEARLLQYLVEHTGTIVKREALLVEVFGYAPTSKTSTLTTTIRRLRAALEPVGGAACIQTIYGEGYRYRTPPSTRALFGRDAAYGELLGALQRGARLVSIVGFGGIGKTALAKRLVAEQGGRLCRLDDAQEAGQIWEPIAAALLLPPDQTRPHTVLRALRDQGTLCLVLDNAEKHLTAARQVVERCLREAPGVQMVVTSRLRLALSEEQLIALGPLSTEAAVELLVARAGALGVSLQGEDLSDIVDALDRHPLAIEIAAGRLRTLSLSQLRQRFDARLRLLTRANGPSRHRDVRSLVVASLELIEPQSALALQQIAVLPGSFDLLRFSAIVSVAGAWPEDLLQSLVEHHLIQRDGEQFRLHFMVRDVVVEGAPGAVAAAAQGRFIDWLLTRPSHRPRVEEIQEGIQLCRGRGDLVRAAALVADLGERWRQESRAAGALRPWLSVADPSDQKVLARLLVLRAFVHRFFDPMAALSWAEQAVAAAARFPRVLEDALYQRARAKALLDDVSGAHEDVARLRAIETDDPAFRVRIAIDAASAYLTTNDPHAAGESLNAVRLDLDAAPVSDRLWFDALGLSVAMACGAFARARRHAYRQQTLAHAAGNLPQRVRAALDVGYYEGQHARLEASHAVQDAVRAHAWRCGHWTEMRLLCNLLGMETWLGRIDDAHQTAASIRQRLAEDGEGRAGRLGRLMLAQFHRVLGQLDEAESWLTLLSDPLLTAVERARCAAQRGDIDAAFSALEQPLQSDVLAARFCQAELWVATGDTHAALEMIEAVLSSSPLAPIDRQPMEALHRGLRRLPPEEPSTLPIPRCWDAWSLFRVGRSAQAEALLATLEPISTQISANGELPWRIALARNASHQR